uniref:Uncharacterized protein n=1 Tax=Rhizophora mucronata TaxID=61149 RepID=A0A2P2JMV2_RHIMU
MTLPTSHTYRFHETRYIVAKQYWLLELFTMDIKHGQIKCSKVSNRLICNKNYAYIR